MSQTLKQQLTQLLLDKGCTVNAHAIDTLATFIGSYTNHTLSRLKDKVALIQDRVDGEVAE